MKDGSSRVDGEWMNVQRRCSENGSSTPLASSFNNWLIFVLMLLTQPPHRPSHFVGTCPKCHEAWTTAWCLVSRDCT
jgi:hypothetical protein